MCQWTQFEEQINPFFYLLTAAIQQADFCWLLYVAIIPLVSPKAISISCLLDDLNGIFFSELKKNGRKMDNGHYYIFRGDCFSQFFAVIELVGRWGKTLF